MVLQLRTRLSLCELLVSMSESRVRVIFDKCGIQLNPPTDYESVRRVAAEYIPEYVTPEQLGALLDELVRSRKTHRPDWEWGAVFDERWDDLERCLAIDGYRIDGNRIIPIDPSVDVTAPVEDDLTAALRASDLPEAEQIIGSIESAITAFRRTPPDPVGCLANARVALHDLAKAIAKHRQTTRGGKFDPEKWGEVAAYLRTSGLITKSQEDGVTGVYSFISETVHGLDEREAARLGLSLTVRMMYFLIKRYQEA